LHASRSEKRGAPGQLAFTSGGQPAISYFDPNNANLKYAVRAAARVAQQLNSEIQHLKSQLVEVLFD
jgi:hypothetical protein